MSTQPRLPTLRFPRPAEPSAAPIASTGNWLHVLSHLDPKYGGLSSAVPELCGALARIPRCGIELAAFVAPGEEFRPPVLPASTVSFWPLRHGSWVHNNGAQKKFAQKLRHVDGLHVHGLWEQSTATACRNARRLSKPYLLSAHGMLEPWALRHKRLKKLIYSALVERANVNGAACLHALTRAEALNYRRFGSSKPVAVIPNGVQIPDTRDPEPFFAAHPQLRGKRILLFLGRLHTKKGVDLLLEAWAQSTRSADAHLVLAGPVPPDFRATLDRIVAANHLEHEVTFAGMLTGSLKWSALAAAEVFVLPSFSEGLSVAVLEALGMGLPCLITAPCNMPEVAQHHAGWILQPELSALTAALTQLWQRSPAEHQAMGSDGAALVAASYTWPSVAQRMAEVYRWVLGGPTPIRTEIIIGNGAPR